MTIRELINSIPSYIKFNTLHFNDVLSSYTGAELTLALAAVPTHVTTLKLGGNNLGNKTSAELTLAFAAIPDHVITLDLFGNGLGNKPDAALAQALAAISPHVTTLDLSFNNLGSQIRANSILLCSFPGNIKHIILDHNNVFNVQTIHNADHSLRHMTATVPDFTYRFQLFGNGLSPLSCVLTPLMSWGRGGRLTWIALDLILEYCCNIPSNKTLFAYNENLQRPKT